LSAGGLGLLPKHEVGGTEFLFVFSMGMDGGGIGREKPLSKVPIAVPSH
jgi:hypothetical protein